MHTKSCKDKHIVGHSESVDSETELSWKQLEVKCLILKFWDYKEKE